MRKYISLFIGFVIIAASFFAYKKLADSKKSKKHPTKKIIKTVSTQLVDNKTIPIFLTSSGILQAKNRIDLFTEVQGIVSTSKEFKPGVFYNKGEVLLRINSDEFRANLKAQKSNFYSVLTAMMPDLQLDFPEVYPKWKQYLTRFDMQKNVAELPVMSTEKEKFFITGRKILSTYYSVKNAEARLAKYRILAPFSGVLSETMVNPGALVRPGQKLGSFVNTSIYELVVNINTEYMDLLQKGKKVILENAEHSKEWQGVVSRINPIVDASSQAIKAYITLRGKELKEGMYLEAKLPIKSVDKAFEISRKLLVDENKIYVVIDNVLSLQTVELLFYKEKTVIVSGLKNGTRILKTPVPGAYDGMQVKTKKTEPEN